MASCMWCGAPASTQVNLGKGKRLQLVPACPTHAHQIEDSKARDEADRQKAKEQKKWW